MSFSWEKGDLAKMKKDCRNIKKDDIVRIVAVCGYNNIVVHYTNHGKYSPTEERVSEDELLLPWK